MNELRVEHAAAAERTRIARDVHDVVAHSLTVVMLHVTGARRALATDPARADEALARAEMVGRESLDSIRQVMGLLRDPGGGHPTCRRTGARPTCAALIDGYRAGGLDVTSDRQLDADGSLDPAVELVVFRVVQESLANVLQHAPGAACRRRGARWRRRHRSPRRRWTVGNAASLRDPARCDLRTGLGVRGHGRAGACARRSPRGRPGDRRRMDGAGDDPAPGFEDGARRAEEPPIATDPPETIEGGWPTSIGR